MGHQLVEGVQNGASLSLISLVECNLLAEIIAIFLGFLSLANHQSAPVDN